MVLYWLSCKVTKSREYTKLFLWGVMFFYKPIFIWPDIKLNCVKNLSYTIHISGCSFMTFGVMMYAISAENFTKTVSVLFYLNVPVMVVMKLSVLWYKSKDFIPLLDQIENDFWPHDIIEGGKSKDTVIRFYKFLNISIVCFSIAAIFFIPSLIIAPIFNSDQLLPFEVKYPFDIEKSPIYELIYCMQVFTVVITIMCGGVGSPLLLLGYLLSLSSQYCILEECFLLFNTNEMFKVNKKMRKLCNDGLEHLYDEKKEYLIRCVKFHQMLLNFSKKLNKAMNPTEIIQLIISIFAFCLGALQFTFGNLTLVEIIVSFWYIMGFLMQLLVDCALGTLLYYQASLIPDALFQSNWINLESNELKKDILFILQHSQRIPQFSAYNIYDLHMMSYIKVLKVAFSFYTVLSSVSKK